MDLQASNAKRRRLVIGDLDLEEAEDERDFVLAGEKILNSGRSGTL